MKRSPSPAFLAVALLFLAPVAVLRAEPSGGRESAREASRGASPEDRSLVAGTESLLKKDPAAFWLLGAAERERRLAVLRRLRGADAEAAIRLGRRNVSADQKLVPTAREDRADEAVDGAKGPSKEVSRESARGAAAASPAKPRGKSGKEPPAPDRRKSAEKASPPPPDSGDWVDDLWNYWDQLGKKKR